MSDFEKAAKLLRRTNGGIASLKKVQTETLEQQHSQESQKGLNGLQQLVRQELKGSTDGINSDSWESVADRHKVDIRLEASPVQEFDFRSDSIHSDKSAIASSFGFDSEKIVEPEVSSPIAQGKNKLEISFSSFSERGFITPGSAKGQLTEEFRRLKRPLLKRMIDDAHNGRNNVIMVTSSVQGEGKTYTSINLSVSLAQEKNRSVLLIDADVLKGTAGIEFGMSRNEPGLLNLLEQTDADPSALILSTNIPGLEFMPAGTENPDANELLTSDRMQQVVNQVKANKEDRIIILDCPPILQTNEAAALSEYADQIVFVVAEEQTSQNVVSQALKYFDTDKYVGVVLNKSSRSRAAYGYGYNYEHA